MSPDTESLWGNIIIYFISMKYRKKPVVIEAENWVPSNPHFKTREIAGYPDSSYRQQQKVWDCGVYEAATKTGYAIQTLEGIHEVTEGDWIITGVKGEKYPCKPDIFEMTYEKVSESWYGIPPKGSL